MLKQLTAQKKTIYYIIAALGLCFIALLVFVFKNAGNVPSTRSQGYTQPTPISNDLEQPEKVVEQTISVAAAETENTTPAKCSKRCASTLSLLDQDLNLDDETFRKLSAHSKELAAYLRNDESKRNHYLQVAMTTIDDDKRSFLIDIFKQLPQEQKITLGDNLITAEGWRARADGVELIVDDGVSDLTMVNKLISIISNEKNSYVKSSILTHLKHSETLKGDTEFLYKLDSVINNDVNPSTRVEALKTKMQLSAQPFHILPDAVQALRTSEPELQVAALIIIGQVLKNENEHLENGAFIDKKTLKNEIQNIRDISPDGEDKKKLEFLIRNADSVYSRYFER